MVRNTLSFSISPQNESDIHGIIHQISSIPVEAYSSTVGNNLNSTHGPQFAIDPLSSNRWQSENIQNQWIVINFTAHEIFTTHYSVQTIDYASNTHFHAKKWKVHGMYQDSWTQIDEVTSSILNNRLAVETRPVSNYGPYSAFRFTSTGENWYPGLSYYFMFLNIDFFGSDTSSTSSNTDISLFNFICLFPFGFLIIASFNRFILSFI